MEGRTEGNNTGETTQMMETTTGKQDRGGANNDVATQDGGENRCGTKHDNGDNKGVTTRRVAPTMLERKYIVGTTIWKSINIATIKWRGAINIGQTKPKLGVQTIPFKEI